MATINDFYPTDDVDDVLDDWIRELIPSSLRSEYKNSETLSGTRALLDADTPYQRFDCNGASRIAKMPTGDAVNNHPFIVVNSTSSGTHVLNIQNNAGSVTLIGLNPSEWAFLVPDGNGGYFVANKPFGSVLTPSQITSNQDNYNPTGAGSADVLRISSDAARNITGLAFPAANKNILVENVGSFTITLKNNVTSTAANRFLIGADFELGADQTVMLYYDATSSRWRMVGGGGSGGGGGLTVSIASVTTSNVTGVEGTHHILDVSGMTANRDFNLPTPTAAGERCKVTLSAGDATYALIVKVNSSEVTRLFITNETLEFVSTGTGAGNWQLAQDGRIGSVGVMERQTAQSINSGADTKIQLATIISNIGDVCDNATNYRVTCRRAGIYTIKGYVALAGAIDDQEGVTAEIFINGVVNRYLQTFVSSASADRQGTAEVVFEKSLAVGDYVELYVFHNEGAAVNTNTSTYPQLSVIELGSGGGASGGSALADGDYGDVTVGGSGTTMTIDNDAVTLAKLVNATAQYRLLGRLSASAGDFEEITASANVFSLLQAADYAAMRTLLGLVIGTNVQAYDADLTTWAGLTPSANAQSLVTAADYAAMRTLLGLVIGTNVQAYDADLTTWAGKTAPSGTVLGTTDTQTLTNKRITPRVGTVTSSATPTINTDNVDVFTITALAVDITSMTTNLSGTPTDGQKLLIAITGTATRAITWGASFEASTIALPTTTSGTNRLDVGFIWNAATSKWRCVGYV